MPLRNFVHRRQHKERGQLSHRKKLGLLEKHKDYVQRAKDHHSKRDRIKRLREKALLEKNKDEFYFGMVKGRVEVSPKSLIPIVLSQSHLTPYVFTLSPTERSPL